MGKHLVRDLDHLKKAILTMGSMVEEATHKAILALVERRSDLVDEVVTGDDHMDCTEVRIEEDCLKVLALHQPVAGDLRFLVTVMKVNNDLERMGDLAVNIAERAAYLSTHEPISVPLDFKKMAGQVRMMLRDSLDALVNLDTGLAHEVIHEDDIVDATHREMFTALQALMQKDASTIARAIHTLSATRHLERMADLATNIAEDVIFMVDGDIIRHNAADF